MRIPILEVREGINGFIVQTQHDEVPVGDGFPNKLWWSTTHDNYQYTVESTKDGRGIIVTIEPGTG